MWFLMGVKSGQGAYMATENTPSYQTRKRRLEKRTLFSFYTLKILQNQFKT